MLNNLLKKWHYNRRSLGYTLGIVRFNLIMLIAGSALLLVGQGQDLLVGFAEDVAEGGAGWVVAVFCLAVFFWAFSIWLWARTLLDVDFNDTPLCVDCNQQASGEQTEGYSEGKEVADQDAMRCKALGFWRLNLPRVLAALAFVAVTWGLWSAQASVESASQAAVLEWLGWGSLSFGAFFLVFVSSRVPLTRWLAKTLNRPNLLDLLHARSDHRPNDLPIKRFWTLFNVRDGVRGRFIVLSVLLGGVLFFWSWLHPVSLGTLGSSTSVIVLVFVWAATWLPLGSVVTYWANRSGLPLLAILIIFAVAFSYRNDNHEIARLTEPGDIASRIVIGKAARQWRDDQTKGEGPVPMVIVATAGGGIRAAYWTATVLGKLQVVDGNQPATTDFDQRLFAISGVSGGSVGAAVYRAVIDARQQQGAELGCGNVLQCSQAVLSENLLGSGAVALLYPDLAQRFWPWPYTSADRGRALELGWEHAFNKVTGSDRLAESILALNDVLPSVNGEGHRPWPALFLNATWTGNGRRIVASNLLLDESPTDIGVDQLTELGRAIALSTAAHNSARFTGLSPAGTWTNDNGEIGRLVDGGYYENFGADTAREIMERIEVADRDFFKNVKPVVIVISSDPGLGAKPVQSGEDYPRSVLFGYEVRSVLRGLFRTRSARGAEAFSQLEQWTEGKGGEFVHLRMCGSEGEELEPPLGWVLSRAAQQKINSYLDEDGQTECVRENVKRLNEVKSYLRG